MSKRVLLTGRDPEREAKFWELVQAQARIIEDLKAQLEDLKAQLADAQAENERLEASAESAHRARHSADMQNDRTRAELRDLRERTGHATAEHATRRKGGFCV